MIELKSSLAKAKHKREVIKQNKKIYHFWKNNDFRLMEQDFSSFDIDYFTGFTKGYNFNPITSDISIFLYDLFFVKNLAPLTNKNKRRLSDYFYCFWRNRLIKNVPFSQDALDTLKTVISNPYFWFFCNCTFTVEQEKNFILDNMYELIELKQSELMAIKNYIKDEENQELFDKKVLFVSKFLS